MTSAYRYFGLLFGRLTVKVRLDSAAFASKSSGDHVAVWAGVNAPRNEAWVQGGVLMESFDASPSAYIEVTPPPGSGDYELRQWPLGFGVGVTVRLRRRHGVWRVTVTYDHEVTPGSVESTTKGSREVRIARSATIDATLEILGSASATAHIGRKLARGGPS
jgi:hypothetical protein